MQSLTTGRPPSFTRDYIDCKYPALQHIDLTIESDEPEEENDNDCMSLPYFSSFLRLLHPYSPHSSPTVNTWGCRFAIQCVAEVAARALAAEPPTYATILELDRKVRDFPIPPEVVAILEDLKAPAEDEEPLPLTTSMERMVLSHCREVGECLCLLCLFSSVLSLGLVWNQTSCTCSSPITIVLLWIHRSYFAQAIIDCPTNPLRSQYAPSFLATYRASVIVLKTIKNQFQRYPRLCSRFWLIWTYAFSAAVSRVSC